MELDEGELFMELIRDVANELDIDVLCHKILVNVGLLTHADRGSLFLAKGPPNNRYLVAKLFDVTQKTRKLILNNTTSSSITSNPPTISLFLSLLFIYSFLIVISTYTLLPIFNRIAKCVFITIPFSVFCLCFFFITKYNCII